MVYAKYGFFKICAAYAWFLCCFPATLPFVKDFDYVFKRKHGVFLISIIFWAMFTIGVLNFLTLPAEGELERYYYEKVAGWVMLLVFFISDACVRFVFIFRSKCLAQLVKGMYGLRMRLTDRDKAFDASQKNNVKKYYADYMALIILSISYWTYAILHTQHYYFPADSATLQQFYFIPVSSNSFWFTGVLLWQDHGHDFAIYFAYCTVYMIGTELADLYLITVRQGVSLRCSEKGVLEERGKTVGESVRRGTAVELEDQKWIRDSRVAELCENFKTVVDFFKEYRKISGLLSTGLLIECTYDVFFCVKDLVTNQGDSAKMNLFGSIAGIVCFLSLTNVGEIIEKNISEAKDFLREAKALEQPSDRSFDRRLHQLETWILNWDWRLTALNYFCINRSLVIGVLVAILSYVLIFFQLRLTATTTTEGRRCLECVCNSSQIVAESMLNQTPQCFFNSV